MMEVPLHIIEAIINGVDTKSKARFCCVNKYFKTFIGNVAPRYIVHQEHFFDTLSELCDNKRHAYFNVSINSNSHRIILADENAHEVYLYILHKGSSHKPTDKIITRTYVKEHIVKNLRKLVLDKKPLRCGTDSAQDIFYGLFENIKSVNVVSAHVSRCHRVWLEYLAGSMH